MAIVTGLTAARMLEIEAASVVDGTVDAAGELTFSTHGGTLIPAGNVKGPKGDSGGSVSFEISFATPSTTWTCVHNLGKKIVDVTTMDTSGVQIEGDVNYVDVNTVVISWYYATAGIALIQ